MIRIRIKNGKQKHNQAQITRHEYVSAQSHKINSLNMVQSRECHEMLHPDLPPFAVLLSWKAFSSNSIKVPMSLLVF